jgi:hypothetical protein
LLHHFLSGVCSQALQGKSLDSVFVCCGGGGMLAGVSAFIKALHPEVKVFGVEAADAAGMCNIFQDVVCCVLVWFYCVGFVFIDFSCNISFDKESLASMKNNAQVY